MAAPYPAIWTNSGVRGASGAGSKQVALTLTPTMSAESAAVRAVSAAREGARVLLIRNTVSAAVETWREIEKLAPGLLLQVNSGPALHHARFAAEDRLLLDKAVEFALGKGSGNNPVIVVGSQTLEQSLDLDADFLLTDLCPMDVLLQRIGRLHRHGGRERPPGFEGARAEVMAPEKGLSALAAPPAFENGLGAWVETGGVIQGIYTGLTGLEATRREIVNKPIWDIPAMNRELVEAATHPELLEVITDEMGWRSYENAVAGKSIAGAMQGKYVTYSKAEPFWTSFSVLSDEDDHVRTRLGATGPVYTLPDGTVGPFGTLISEISLPAHWSKGLTGEEDVLVETGDDGPAFQIGKRCFYYRREGIFKA